MILEQESRRMRGDAMALEALTENPDLEIKFANSTIGIFDCGKWYGKGLSMRLCRRKACHNRPALSVSG